MLISSTKQRIQNHYDNESKTYEDTRPFMKSYIFQRILKVIRHLCTDTIEYGTVLDLGCGSGALSRATRQYLPKACVVSLDLSSRMVESLKKSDPEIEGIVADAEAPPFKRSIFDLVLCSRMIKMTNYSALIKSVSKKLKRSGRICIVFDSSDVLWVKILEKLGKPIDIGNSYGYTNSIGYRTLRLGDLVEVLKNSDFELVRMIPVTVLPLSIFRHIRTFFWGVIEFLDKPISSGRVEVLIAKPLVNI